MRLTKRLVNLRAPGLQKETTSLGGSDRFQARPAGTGIETGSHNAGTRPAEKQDSWIAGRQGRKARCARSRARGGEAPRTEPHRTAATGASRRTGAGADLKGRPEAGAPQDVSFLRGISRAGRDDLRKTAGKPRAGQRAYEPRLGGKCQTGPKSESQYRLTLPGCTICPKESLAYLERYARASNLAMCRNCCRHRLRGPTQCDHRC